MMYYLPVWGTMWYQTTFSCCTGSHMIEHIFHCPATWECTRLNRSSSCLNFLVFVLTPLSMNQKDKLSLDKFLRLQILRIRGCSYSTRYPGSWFLHFIWMSRVVTCLKIQKENSWENFDTLTRHSPADQWATLLSESNWLSKAENIYFSWKWWDFDWSMQIVNTDGPLNDWLIQQFTKWRHQFISVSICQSQRIRFREYQKLSFRFLIMEIFSRNFKMESHQMIK